MNYKDFTDEELFLEAMSLLEEVTPAKYDCGKLCGSLCCKDNSDGEQGSLGMWLLPGEKEFLERNTDYIFLKDESGNDVAVCDGECDRELRPFACRVYPYYASLTQGEGGRIGIKIKPDPRAQASCPLLWKALGHKPNPGFLRAYTRAVRMLLARESFKKELFAQSGFLDEISEMRSKFFGGR